MDNNGVSGVNNSVAVYVGNFALVNKAENKLFKQDNVGGVGSVVKVNVANSAHPYGDSGHVIGNGGGGGNNLFAGGFRYSSYTIFSCICGRGDVLRGGGGIVKGILPRGHGFLRLGTYADDDYRLYYGVVEIL